MPTVVLPMNKIQQIQPTLLFDEVFPLAPGPIKQYTMLNVEAFISIQLMMQFNATLVVACTGPGGATVIHYTGAWAANTLYHLELGPGKFITQITITNVGALPGNISIMQYCLQAV